MRFTKTSVAVVWWWITAYLYEQQIFIGVTAVTQACCWPVLKNSPELWGMHFAKPLLQCIGGGSLHIRVNSKSSKVSLQ